MRRSLLRTKLVESRTKVTNRVSERAKSLVPIDMGETQKCMVCGRKMRSRRPGGSDGRVCSPNCARSWAGNLK